MHLPLWLCMCLGGRSDIFRDHSSLSDSGGRDKKQPSILWRRGWGVQYSPKQKLWGMMRCEMMPSKNFSICFHRYILSWPVNPVLQCERGYIVYLIGKKSFSKNAEKLHRDVRVREGPKICVSQDMWWGTSRVESILDTSKSSLEFKTPTLCPSSSVSDGTR